MNRTSACLLSLTLAWCGPTAMALSVFDVIELTSNGYDETEIERLIEVTNARFVIDVDSLLALGEADVEDEIITLMLERGAEPPEELSEADQLIVLREAGFSEETIMQFVQHKNVCEPLADEDEHRLGQAGFSSAFLRDFGAQVEDCREEQESLALIEPLPEEAYEEAPTQVTRVYRTDATVYPATTTVRYPTTTYYPPRYYGIYDSYYYHDRITRVYPIIVYRDYSGHKHRYRKAGHRYGKDRHRARDHDRRRHDGDRRRGDRRGDRDKGDRDRPRRRDSDVRPRRPHPRSDPNPRLLAGDTPADRVHSTTAPRAQRPVPRERRHTERRVEDPRSSQPFVRNTGSRTGPRTGSQPGSATGSPGALPRPVRKSPGVPGDVRRRIERPPAEPKAPAWTSPRPRVSAPIRAKTPEPRFRPPPRTQPLTRPPRTPPVASPPRTPPVSPPPRIRRAAPAPRTPPVVRAEPARRSIKNDQGDTHEK